MADKKKPAAKAKSSAPAPVPTVDRAIVAQVSGELVQRLEAQSAPPPGVVGATPAGVAAFPADFAGKLGKLIPTLLTTGLELAGMARDGKLDIDEARRVGEMVLEFVQKLREPASGPHVVGNAPPPGPAAA